MKPPRLRQESLDIIAGLVKDEIVTQEDADLFIRTQVVRELVKQELARERALEWKARPWWKKILP